MSDVLEKWQRTLKPTLAKDEYGSVSVTPPEPTEPVDADEKNPTRYRLGSLELRPARGLWSLPTYSQLIDILFDGKATSFVALIFLHQVVIIKGRNLSSIVAGLRMRTQWLIEQHDAPLSANEPFVEHMEFITENIPAVVAALRAGSSVPPRKQGHRPSKAEKEED
jgi:hypothetical protein